VIQLFRVVLSRYRVAAVICVGLTAGCAWLASEAVPALYPVYVPRRTDPDAPALLPGRAPMKALPAEPSTPDDPSGAPR